MSSNGKKPSGRSNDNEKLNKQTNLIPYTDGVKKLTPAEIAVLDRVEKGYANEEISNQLGLSVRTIHTHRHSICKKLGIQGRGGLIKWLLQAHRE